MSRGGYNVIYMLRGAVDVSNREKLFGSNGKVEENFQLRKAGRFHCKRSSKGSKNFIILNNAVYAG